MDGTQRTTTLFRSLIVAALFSLSAATAFAGPVATGHGNLTDDDGRLRTFSFTAVEHSDGTFRGQAQLKNRRLVDPAKSHIVVNCAVADGNTVLVGGIDDDGEAVAFGVQDNGEGRHAEPDRMTLVTNFSMDPVVGPLIFMGDCAGLAAVVEGIGGVDFVFEFVLSEPQDIEGGNIQVR